MKQWTTGGLHIAREMARTESDRRVSTAPTGHGVDREWQKGVNSPHGRWRGQRVAEVCQQPPREMARTESDRRVSTAPAGDGVDREWQKVVNSPDGRWRGQRLTGGCQRPPTEDGADRD